ncbi:MAG: transposase [Gammaproteobacteria bacterium]|nr:transposase [Gammaproteobacteria bacterium]
MHRQEAQFARPGVTLGRATMAQWMIQLGGTHVVPLISLLAGHLLAAPPIHCDETRLQVLRGEKAGDHWMWVRAAGPSGQLAVPPALPRTIDGRAWRAQGLARRADGRARAQRCKRLDHSSLSLDGWASSIPSKAATFLGHR